MVRLGSFIPTVFRGNKRHPEAQSVLVSISLARRERLLAGEDIVAAARHLQSAADHLSKAVKYLNDETKT